ncbi:MAG: alanine--glyoxylate aminotransferase family protein, partial [Chloroflexi bacterium]|nr:alanine--glyoxylate aminotransferase family protein [Chloroflexota bacterium]
MSSQSQPNLRIPGPVPLPDDVLEIAGSQMINHRGPLYADMLDRMTANLKTVMMTANDVYFITASGTGAMEAAVVNTLSPGDRVLSIIIGAFGERFAEIAEAYGTDVT